MTHDTPSSAPVVVLSASRFGGNYLLDMLARARPSDWIFNDLFHPGAKVRPEEADRLSLRPDDLADMLRDNPSEAWRHVRQSASAAGVQAVVKVYYYHFPRDAALWETLHRTARIVHLIRRDLLASFVSRQRAETDGKWAVSAKEARRMPRPAPLTVNPAMAHRFVQMRREEIEWARSAFQTANYSEIYFEDIARGPYRCARTIAEVFGPVSAPTIYDGSGLLRLRRNSLAEVLTNYAEVAHLDAPVARLTAPDPGKGLDPVRALQ